MISVFLCFTFSILYQSSALYVLCSSSEFEEFIYYRYQPLLNYFISSGVGAELAIWLSVVPINIMFLAVFYICYKALSKQKRLPKSHR